MKVKIVELKMKGKNASSLRPEKDEGIFLEKTEEM